jgi:hypothetical protein
MHSAFNCQGSTEQVKKGQNKTYTHMFQRLFLEGKGKAQIYSPNANNHADGAKISKA